MATSDRTPTVGGAEDRNRKDVTRLIVIGLLLVLLIAFIIGNSERVRVSFVFWHSDVRLIWVLIFTVALGIVIDRLIIWQRERRRKEKASEEGGPGRAA